MAAALLRAASPSTPQARSPKRGRHPEDTYRIDYDILTGERRGSDGFVASQIDELKDSKAVAMMGVEAGVGSPHSTGRHTRCSKEPARTAQVLYGWWWR
jgi:hypothetical protein